MRWKNHALTTLLYSSAAIAILILLTNSAQAGKIIGNG